MTFSGFLLYPFSILYGFILFVRNKLYDWGIFTSESFEVPIISVGNLSMGGAGKTPHIEYLIRLLTSNNMKVATLSRGYKRKTKGFVLANDSTAYEDIGDEPMMFYNKYRDVTVAVAEDRCHGVRELLKHDPAIDVVLLDDAFQHRAVKADVSILITDFHNMYTKNFVLPSGDLREFRSGMKRADVIIVSKIPTPFSPIVKRSIVEVIARKQYQELLFSQISYDEMKSLVEINNNSCEDSVAVLLFAGIVNTYPLEDYLRSVSSELEIIKFPDHHHYTEDDLRQIKGKYDAMLYKNKIIVTTEKDAMRLKDSPALGVLKGLPVFHVPIRIGFVDDDKQKLDSFVLNVVNKKRNSWNNVGK